jgi:hypothetical protein
MQRKDVERERKIHEVHPRQEKDGDPKKKGSHNRLGLLDQKFQRQMDNITIIIIITIYLCKKQRSAS